MVRRIGTSLAAVALIGVGIGATAVSQALAGQRPNMIMITTDDQTVESMRLMPATRSEIGRAGVTFSRSFVNYPLCCPSRITYLTGQYAHNHGIFDNTPPLGGYESFVGVDNTLPVWLQDAGYYTGHVGKYPNGYEDIADVPPGWTEWYGLTRVYHYYNYRLNENGVLVDYGRRAREYQTDVLTEKSVDFIRRRAPARRPFFLSVDYLAPHQGSAGIQLPFDCANTAQPAPRHADAFDREPLPAPPSLNEADVSDKPADIQKLSPAGVFELRRKYRCRAESLLSVDEGVAEIVETLRQEGELSRTLIAYTSDNGFFTGEHRIRTGKRRVYEESVRVPLLLRGPGVSRGARVAELAINADLPATLLDVADAEPGRVLDGISLVRAARRPEREIGRALLIEGIAAAGRYAAVRTRRFVYVEHETGERELYDLDTDPYQLENRFLDPAYAGRVAALAPLLDDLRTCVGAGCRVLPAIELELEFDTGPGGCARKPVDALLDGLDTPSAERVVFRVNDERVAVDDELPFEQRLPFGELQQRRRAAVDVSVSLVDGRRLTRTGRVRACPS
jgi:N-acetylglucosamine-6-sulfatase